MERGTNAKLLTHGHPPKLTGWARRSLFRQAAMRPLGKLQELQRSTVQEGESVSKVIIIHSLHTFGLLMESEPFLKENYKKSGL